MGDYTVFYQMLTGATVAPLARGATLIRLNPYFNFNTIANYFHDNDDWHTAIKPGLVAQLSVDRERALRDAVAALAAEGREVRFVGAAQGGGPAPQILRAMENLKTALRLRLSRGPLDEAQIRAVAAALDAAALERLQRRLAPAAQRESGGDAER